MIFFDLENNQIGEDSNEPDWSVWRIDHYEDETDCEGNILDSRTYCRRTTEEEIEGETRQELVNMLPDAVAELSELVSILVEGTKNNG